MVNTRETGLERAEIESSNFPGGMEPIRANEWVAEIENNFRLLRCTDAQKVEIRSYLLVGEANRWWNLKSIAEPDMDWERFLEIFKEKFMTRAM